MASYFLFWNEPTSSSFTSWNTTIPFYSFTRVNCGEGIARNSSKSILFKRWKPGEKSIGYVKKQYSKSFVSSYIFYCYFPGSDVSKLGKRSWRVWYKKTSNQRTLIQPAKPNWRSSRMQLKVIIRLTKVTEITFKPTPRHKIPHE